MSADCVIDVGDGAAAFGCGNFPIARQTRSIGRCLACVLSRLLDKILGI